MDILPLIPQNSNYNAQRGESVRQIILPGGKPRTRRAYEGSWSLVDIEWVLNANEFHVLQMFYDTQLDAGAGSFQLELILDKPARELHEVVFVKDSLQIVGQQGLAYFVSAQVFAKPMPINHELNRLRLEAYRNDPKVDLLSVFFEPIVPAVVDFTFFFTLHESVQALEISELFLNPQFRDLIYSSDFIPDGLILNPNTGLIEGTIGSSQAVGDFPVTFTVSNAEGQETTHTIEWRIREADHVGIDKMQIGTTFIVD